MSLQTKIIGRQPTDHGPYDPNIAYGKKFQCTLFGCAWESLHDNNITAPAVWDGGDTITPNLVDWKKVSGSYEAWLMNHDKPAASEQYPFNGMGRVTLQKNIVNGVNTLTQAMLNQQNTIYVIQYDFTLGEDITIPSNCVLDFDGGSISGVYTLTGNNTRIIGKSCIDCTISGTLKDNIFKVSWFKINTFTKILANFINYANTITDYATLDIDLENARLYVDATSLPSFACSHLKINGHNNIIHFTVAPNSGAMLNFENNSSLNGLNISNLTFYVDTQIADNCPVFLFANYSGITFTDCYFQNCGIGVQMGTTTKPAGGLTLKNVSATLSNIGKPFVRLVYGAGFTWNTHDSISHNEAAVPAEGQPMNTVAGTNAVDIVGPWDSADIDILCEKLYRGVNIAPEADKAAGAIYYIKVHDCIFDYMKDSAICANQTVDIANNHFTIENNYIWCYVTDDIHVDGIYLYGKGSHIDHAVIKNNNIIQATRSIVTGALNTVMLDTDIEENLLSGDIYLMGLSKGVVKNNRTNGAFVYIIQDNACIIGNIAREYNVQNHTTSYVKNNVMTVYDDYREWNP